MRKKPITRENAGSGEDKADLSVIFGLSVFMNVIDLHHGVLYDGKQTKSFSLNLEEKCNK